VSDVTTIDITVDEQTMPTVVTVLDVDVLPDLIEMETDVYEVTVVPEVSAPALVEVSTGIPGSPGPPGPPGIVRVNHGAFADTARPDAPIVLWVGSVTPIHRDETVDLIAWTP